jgi:2-keto-4-pentenoate hydratase/2-oxohepta-3-ene-1,7-dioic acid hydratase (catechol pathway)
MNINRIFCIGKNYAAHVEELSHLGHQPDGECVIFMKPASAVVPVGTPLPLPRGLGSVHHEAELVVRLGGGGRDLDEARALRHISHLTLGLDLTLRDLQTRLKDRGAPWELAKSFDGSAPLGRWIPHDNRDLQAIQFTCHVNGALRQHGHTARMLFPVARQIALLSRSWNLADGDIIFTGTPEGVGPLAPGDEIAIAATGIGSFQWTCT